jgi:hypothetical protein
MKFNEEIETSTNYPDLEKQLKDNFELVSKFNYDLSKEYEKSITSSFNERVNEKNFTTVLHDQKKELLTHLNDIELLIVATNTNKIKFSEN